MKIIIANLHSKALPSGKFWYKYFHSFHPRGAMGLPAVCDCGIS